MAVNTHESFDREHSQEGSSDRSFGLVFAGAFTVLALWPMVRKHPMRPWALWVAGAFLLVALIAPKILHGLNLLWARFGLLISKVTNPIITGLMFFVIFAPAGFILRMLGKDLLRLKYDPLATSYWILRDPPGPPPPTMRNAF